MFPLPDSQPINDALTRRPMRMMGYANYSMKNAIFSPLVLAYTAFNLTAIPAHAVLVATQNPGNLRTAPPANGAPWTSVLSTNGNASSVYLGGGWVLTAEHVFDDIVNPYVTHNSINYLADLGKSYVLDNPASFPGTGLTAKADLVLFKLVGDIPGLPTISLGAATASLDITMIGFGGGKSWGTNNIEGSPLLLDIDYSNPVDNDFRGFRTDYDTATQSEAQGTGGDSGGGAFAFQGGAWKLVGIMLAIDTDPNPDLTYFADINTYASQINALIPEPSSLILSISSLALLLCRRR